MAGANLVILITAKDMASGVLRGMTGEIGNFGKAATQVGTKLSIGLTAPLSALGFVSFKAASDMAESASKMAVVFGEVAPAVEEFAKSAAANLGMSKQAATEAAGTFGNLFAAMGLGKPEMAAMSTNVLQLAADLASFNNIRPEEALEKLRAGLVGESEPLRVLGVNISAAAVDMRALEMGLAATAKELTEADKVTARYALIMEQTNLAQGDFARTSQGVANQTRITQAKMADLSAEMGTRLLPIGLQAIEFVSDLTTRFGALSPETQTAIVAGAGFLAVLGPLTTAIGTAATVTATLLPILGLLRTALMVQVIPAIGATAATVTATLLPILGLLRTALMVQVIPAIGATVIALAPILLPIAAIGLAIGLMALAWSQNWGDVQGKTEAVVGAVKSVMDTIGPVVERVWTGAVETVRSAINNIIQAINRLIGAWNAIEFTVPRIEVPSVGPIQGFSLGGFTIGTPDVGLIPLLDRGGIVTRPTIALLAANRRPEAILPLGANGNIPIDYGRLAAAMARQPIIVQMDRREVGRMVREELLALGRQNLSVGLA